MHNNRRLAIHYYVENKQDNFLFRFLASTINVALNCNIELHVTYRAETRGFLSNLNSHILAIYWNWIPSYIATTKLTSRKW